MVRKARIGAIYRHARRSALLAALVLIDAPLWPAGAAAENITYDELKFGGLVHDAHFLGGREKGADLNPELILQSPVTDAMLAGSPPWLRWALQPRPTFGAEINTSGYTNQWYFGATWTWLVAGNIVQPQDGIFLSYFFGPGFNDGDIIARRPDHKSLGSSILFREAFDLGYQFASGYNVSLFIDHVSNGGLAKHNQSINDVGLRLGLRF